MTIKKHKPFTNFECLTPVQKTLRFRLIPVGRTTELLNAEILLRLTGKEARCTPC